MTTFLTAQTRETEVEDTTPGCGCCVPPPDAVDSRMALLEERRERVERRLRAVRA